MFYLSLSADFISFSSFKINMLAKNNNIKEAIGKYAPISKDGLAFIPISISLGYPKKIPTIKKIVKRMLNLFSLICNNLFLYLNIATIVRKIIAIFRRIKGNVIMLLKWFSEPGVIFFNSIILSL